ncbi:PAS domain S-box protein [Candidatus Fermentibacteria bacterium]|nr:PAS domain S-box protein [Candidatus Fermentibacteria bacterium]
MKSPRNRAGSPGARPTTRERDAGTRDEALEREVAAYRALIEHMSGGVTIYAAVDDGDDFLIKSINPAGQRISGIPREDAVGRRLTEVLPAVAGSGLLAVLREVHKAKDPRVHGPACYASVSVDHWVKHRVYPLPSGEIVVVSEDVSDEVRAARALGVAEDRFRQLADNLPVGLYRTTLEGRILYVNRVLSEILGYSCPEDLVTQSAAGGYADPGERMCFLELLHQDGIVHAFETQWRCLDGRTVWVRESARIVLAADGTTRFIEGTAEDITAPRAAREALVKAEESLRRFVEIVSDVIYRYDVPTNRYDFISPAFERLTGYPRDYLTGNPLRHTRRVIHPEDAARVYRFLYACFRKPGDPGPHQVDYRIITRDGRTRWVSDRIDLEFDADGVVRRMNGVIRDITDLKRAEQERERLAVELTERVKELNCLSAVSTALGRAEGSLAALLFAAVEAIPAGMQFPEIAAACISLRDETAATPDFRRSAWRMESPLVVAGTTEGRVEVCYVVEPPPGAGDPFLREEIRLLEEVAGRIARRVERWDVTEALRGSEERFRDLVERARIGILIDDPKGTFRYFNDTFAQMFGYSREEMSRQTIETIVHPRELDRVLTQHRRRVQGMTPFSHYEFMGIRKDRLPIHLEVDAIELREGNKVVGTRSYVWDISERKTAEQERERLIGELRTALAKVKTLSGLLPICSSCKRIRDDTGYWEKVETYIHQRSEAEFTHGICPECMKKLYPEFVDEATATPG